MKPAWRWLTAFYANAGHLQHVYLNRKNNPGAYRAAINQLTRQFDRTVRSAPDLQASEDRNAGV